MIKLSDDVLEGLREYGNLTMAMQYAYEIDYYREYKCLPPDAVILDSVLEENGITIIIHRPQISPEKSN